MIVAIEDGNPYFHSFYEKTKRGFVNIFFSKFTRFALKYLNSVPDLIDYLNKKETLLKEKNFIISGGEENLLAHFLGNARTFGELEKSDLTYIYFSDDQLANNFENREEVKLRLSEEYKFGEIINYLIEKKRQSTSPYENIQIPQKIRDSSIQWFLNMKSLEKRMLGKFFIETSIKAYENFIKLKKVEDIPIYRSYYMSGNVLFLLAFLGDESEKYKEIRRTILKFTTYGAIKKLEIPFDYIIGIATEIDFAKRPTHSLEWISLNYKKHSDEINKSIDKDFPDLDDILNKLGILQNPNIQYFNQNEYEKSNFKARFDFKQYNK